MENKNIQQYVGENIRKFRLAHGLTLDEVAARIYKSKSTVSKYENGTISLDIATLEDIANALDVLPAQLLMTPCTNKQVPEAQRLCVPIGRKNTRLIFCLIALLRKQRRSTLF